MKQFAIVFNNFITGGCEKLFINIAKKCPLTTFHLYILRSNIDSSIIEQLPENVMVIDCKYKNVFYRFFHNLKILHNNNYEAVVDFHEVLLSELFLLIGRKNNKCWHWFNCNPIMKLQSRLGKIYYYLFPFYDKVIFICNTQKEILLDIVKKFPEEKSFISYNFVNKDEIINKADECFPNMPDNFILTVARVDYGAKDFDTLIEAYEKFSIAKNTEYKLVIVGDGKDMPLLKQRKEKSPMNNNIILTGNQPNPYPWIKKASLFVLSSYTEGFPITILEAFILGVPVISSNCLCGPSEILDINKYGELFEVKNSTNLQNKIDSILFDQAKYESLVVKGKERAEFYYKSADKTIKELFSDENRI